MIIRTQDGGRVGIALTRHVQGLPGNLNKLMFGADHKKSDAAVMNYNCFLEAFEVRAIAKLLLEAANKMDGERPTREELDKFCQEVGMMGHIGS